MKHLDFLLCDLLSLVVSFFLAYLIRFGNFRNFEPVLWGRLLLLMIFLDIIITLFLSPYSGIFRRHYYEEIGRALQLTFYNMLAAAVFFYVFRIGTNYSRLMFFCTYILYFVISLIFKYFWKKHLSKVKHELTPLFVLASAENFENVVEEINSGDYRNYKILGLYIYNNDNSITKYNEIPVINEGQLDFIFNNKIKEILIAAEPNKLSSEIRHALIDKGITLNYRVEDVTGFQTDDVHIKRIGLSRVIGTQAFAFTPMQVFYLIIKQMLDYFIGLIGSVLVIFPMVLIKIAYLINGDTSPIIYKQKRVGKDGKLINIFKFRSMVPNADEILNDLLKDEKYRREWEANQKLEDDPRITKIGKFLRKTSLDELPQLFNVLLGDMSLVGPRPLVEGELEAHNGLELYHMVKPGITGWWGCNGRSDIDYQERLELEYYYIKNISLYLDLVCILRTFVALIKRRGAK